MTPNDISRINLAEIDLRARKLRADYIAKLFRRKSR